MRTAYFAARVAAPRARAAILLAIVLPLWSSYLVRVFAWRTILQGNGPAQWLLRQIGLGGVRPTVKRLCAKEALPVVIQADENARSGMVIRVIDEAKLGGAKDVSLATEKS